MSAPIIRLLQGTNKSVSVVKEASKKLPPRRKVRKTLEPLPPTVGGKILMVPEIPNDTAETNPILRNATTSTTPTFRNITPYQVYTGISRVSMEAEAYMGLHILEKVADEKYPKTFESVFSELQKYQNYMDSTRQIASVLSAGLGGNYEDSYEVVDKKCTNALKEMLYKQYLAEPLYNALMEIKEKEKDTLTGYEQHLINRYLTIISMNGIMEKRREKKDTIDFCYKVIDMKCDEYIQRLDWTIGESSYLIQDAKELEGLSPFVRMVLSEKDDPDEGPFLMRLVPHLYEELMTNCDNRATRKKFWWWYVNRASDEWLDKNGSNDEGIKDMRHHRFILAETLGFQNYAQKALATTMAGKVETAVWMLENLRDEFKNKANSEISELYEYAKSRGFDDKELQLWDVDYYIKMQKTELYSYDELWVKQFFVFESVLEKLFKFTEDLFMISFREFPNEEVETVHEDVRYFKAYDENDEHIGDLYIDPYVRDSKSPHSHHIGARARSDFDDAKPIAYMNLAIDADKLLEPIGGEERPGFMQHHELVDLMKQFGRALQHLLASTPYQELNSVNFMEPDAWDIVPNFFARWLKEPSILKQFSSHYEHGDQLNYRTIDRIFKREHHMQFYNLMKEIFKSIYDLELNIDDEHFWQIHYQLWPQFFTIPHQNDDSSLSAWTDMCIDYPALYYRGLWSQMVAEDIFAAFKEEGLDNMEGLAQTGKRFRNAFLKHGAGLPTKEMFRRFRGRDPSLHYMMVTLEESQIQTKSPASLAAGDN